MELENLIDFQRDEEYFLNNLKKIKREYRGKYILIKDRKIVLSGKTFGEIERKAERQNIDLGTSVVEFVPEKDVVVLF